MSSINLLDFTNEILAIIIQYLGNEGIRIRESCTVLSRLYDEFGFNEFTLKPLTNTFHKKHFQTFINKLQNVKHLYIRKGYCGTVGTFLKRHPILKQITKLDISAFVSFSKKRNHYFIFEMCNLEDINIRCQLPCEHSFRTSVAGTFPSLKTLSVSHLTYGYNDFLAGISECQHLTSLSVYKEKKIFNWASLGFDTSEVLPQFFSEVGKIPNLKKFECSINSEHIVSEFICNPTLQHLRIHTNFYNPGHGLRSLSHLSNLVHLDIFVKHGCIHLIHSIAQHMPKLRYLRVNTGIVHSCNCIVQSQPTAELINDTLETLIIYDESSVAAFMKLLAYMIAIFCGVKNFSLHTQTFCKINWEIKRYFPPKVEHVRLFDRGVLSTDQLTSLNNCSTLQSIQLTSSKLVYPLMSQDEIYMTRTRYHVLKYMSNFEILQDKISDFVFVLVRRSQRGVKRQQDWEHQSLLKRVKLDEFTQRKI